MFLCLEMRDLLSSRLLDCWALIMEEDEEEEPLVILKLDIGEGPG